MTDSWQFARRGIFYLGFAAVSAVAANDQTAPGDGNARAEEIARRSPIVQSAEKYLQSAAAAIQDSKLRTATLDLIGNSTACVAHRAGLDARRKDAIVRALVMEGLLDPVNESRSPVSLRAGIFPPLLDDDTDCPKVPQPFYAAPGGVAFREHHSYPGGLAIHAAHTVMSALELGRVFARVYESLGPEGLPALTLSRKTRAMLIREDLLVAAAIWHDWPKTFVSQWHADGTIFLEASIGGSGRQDNFGYRGNSKAEAHVILAIAEVMARGLGPELVVALASVHAVPSMGNEYRMVNWIRAAGIIAGTDPIEHGYLYRDRRRRLRIPPVRWPANKSVTGESLMESHSLVEYTIHNMADSAWTFTTPGVREVERLLARLAPEGCATWM